jgi:MFS family permease
LKAKDTNLVLYLASFLVDVALGMIFISVPLLAIRLEANSLKLGELGFVAALFYTFFSLPFGKLSDRLGHRQILLIGCLTYLLSAFFLSLSTKLYQLFLLMSFVGISGAMFWPSLEAWLAERGEKQSLLRRTTHFNLSWCMGAAVGPLIGGSLFQINIRFPLYFAVVASLIIFITIEIKVKEPSFSVRKKTFLGGMAISPEQNCDFEKRFPSSLINPSLTYLYAAWIANFTVYFTLGMIRYLFPKLSTEIGIQPPILGILMFLIAASQTLTFYVLGKTSRWHYRPLPLISLQLVGMVGLMFIFVSNSLFFFICAFLLIGVGAGMTYFSSIFYGLNTLTGRGARSGIHEAVLGSGFLVGPLAGGILAQAYSLKTPYLVAVFIITAGTLVEILLIKR